MSAAAADRVFEDGASANPGLCDRPLATRWPPDRPGSSCSEIDRPCTYDRAVAERQLKEIFRAFHARDELAFRRAAAEIIEEEQGKQHHALARDLQKLLVAGGGFVDGGSSTVVVPAPPKDREGDWELADVRQPERLLEDLVLGKQLLAALDGVVTEVRSWTALDAAGITRRQRLLLQGPPGCGKTSAAEALAAELGRPFLLVRLDAVVSSYLGETASNLRRILDYASQAPFVVLFDEFDALGRSRDDQAEHGEMKRVVTAFLQMTDRYHGPSLLLAATNHAGLLDHALWRRFDEVLTFPLPTIQQTRQLMRLRLKVVKHQGIDVDHYAAALKGKPHAAMEKLVMDARRHAALRDARVLVPEDFEACRRKHQFAPMVGIFGAATPIPA